MPQIEIYVDNDTLIKFLELSDEERSRIRKQAQETIKQEVKKEVET